MNVFISQPMNGIDEEKVLKVRSAIFKAFAMEHPGEAINLIESYFKFPPEGSGRLWCLGDSIKLMDKADIVIFAPGFDQAKGCIIEHKICGEYDVPHLYSNFNDFGDIEFYEKSICHFR